MKLLLYFPLLFWNWNSVARDPQKKRRRKNLKKKLETARGKHAAELHESSDGGYDLRDGEALVFRCPSTALWYMYTLKEWSVGTLQTIRPVPRAFHESRYSPSPPPPPPPPTPSITLSNTSLSISRICHPHENAISRRRRHPGRGLLLPCCAPNCICCHTHVPFRGINPLPPLPQLQQQHVPRHSLRHQQALLSLVTLAM